MLSDLLNSYPDSTRKSKTRFDITLNPKVEADPTNGNSDTGLQDIYVEKFFDNYFLTELIKFASDNKQLSFIKHKISAK